MAGTKAKTTNATSLVEQVETLAQTAVDQPPRALSEEGPAALHRMRHSLSLLLSVLEVAEQLLPTNDLYDPEDADDGETE